MSEEKTPSKETVQEITDIVKPILDHAELLIPYLEDMKFSEKNFNENASNMQAVGGMLVSLEKAEDASLRAKAFEAVVKLVECRKAQQKNAIDKLKPVFPLDSII